MPARRLSLYPLRLRQCLAAWTCAQRVAVASPSPGGIRSRELRPNPIRPDTSRHETAAIPAGAPIPYAAGPAEAEPWARTIPSHAPSLLRAPAREPPCALLAQAARGVPPAFTGGAGEPNGSLHDPLARTSQHRPARFGERAARATRPPGPRAASPAAPRRAPRSAAPEVPSIDELPPSRTPDLRPGIVDVSRAFSTDCHQSVESTRRPFRPVGFTDLDGSAWTETRSLW